MIALRTQRILASAGTLRTLRLDLPFNVKLSTLMTAIVLILISTEIFSQEKQQSGVITSIAEELAADENDQQGAENFADMLRALIEDPVALNSADEKELSRLFFLTGFQVKILCDYVRKNGRIFTIYELANIPGFDQETARMLLPFITLTGDIRETDDTLILHHTLLTNLIIKPGTSDTSSIGSPLKMLMRYSLSAGKFSGGFTIEKDPGEKLLSGHPPMPDYLSVNLAWRGKGFVKRVIIGDYSARFGQGVALNTTALCGYSLSAPFNMSGRDELKPHTSSEENNFFRGIALITGTGRTDILVFLSSVRIDATLADSSADEGTLIKSLYKTGVHNTSSSLVKKDNLRESAFGLNIAHTFKNLNTGIILTGSRFSIPFSQGGGGPADLYDFTGRDIILASGYYSLLLRNFIFSGELAWEGRKKFAFVQNLAFRPCDRLTLNLIYRNYSQGFISFHGRGPGMSSSAGSEKGLTGSFAFEAARFLFINAGTDLRIYPWLRYRNSAPSSTIRHEVRVRYLPSDKLSFEILYGYRSSVNDQGRETSIAIPAESATHSVRFQWRYITSGSLTLTTRIDIKKLIPKGENGVALIQDLSLKIKKVPLSLWFRYGVFSTGSYYTGIYAWENDILYGFSVPVLFGKGSRTYIVARWDIGKKFELRFKYGITSAKTDGLNYKYTDELKFQLLIKL